MRVGIIIVNWNGWRHTRHCVQQLQQSQTGDFHIYLVDNGSTDESLAWLADLGRKVTLIAHPVNAGWCGGNNVGIERALTEGCEYILLLNNDAVLAPRAIEAFLKAHHDLMAAGSAQAPVLGAVELRRDRTWGFVRGVVDAATGIPIWPPADEYKAILKRPLIRTSYVHGAALFSHRSTFERVGKMDERYFLYFDDADWCFRAARAGHELFVVRAAIIAHDGGASTGGHTSPLMTYFMTRNRLLFAAKFCTAEQRRVLGQQYLDGYAKLKKRDIALAAAFKRGVMDYRARRLGDCPPEIRELASAVRERDRMLAKRSTRRRSRIPAEAAQSGSARSVDPPQP